MKYFTREEVMESPSVKMGMPVSTFLSILNGNAEFIFQLARRLKLKYTITSTALYLALRYFVRKSLFSEDRFMICGGSIVLAHKIWDSDARLRNLTGEFDALVCLLEDKANSLSIQKIDEISNALCVAQSLILRDMQFDIEIRLPYEPLNTLIDKYLSPRDRVTPVYNTARIIILDSYRTYLPLLHPPYYVALAAYLIACHYEHIPPFPPALPYLQWLADLQPLFKARPDPLMLLQVLDALNQVLLINS